MSRGFFAVGIFHNKTPQNIGTLWRSAQMYDVGIELDPRATMLGEYDHPERACYLLGAEDHGLSVDARDRCHDLVQIEGPKPQSLNVSVAGSLVMHHRWMSRAEVSVR